mmetsp:Transcript_26021/g.38115  ORF Transcript_26021/g.38115 Transcript_26021/m.38115 type:complete len:144 (-) Transcript_26021:77-508(-)
MTDDVQSRVFGENTREPEKRAYMVALRSADGQHFTSKTPKHTDMNATSAFSDPFKAAEEGFLHSQDFDGPRYEGEGCWLSTERTTRNTHTYMQTYDHKRFTEISREAARPLPRKAREEQNIPEVLMATATVSSFSKTSNFAPA